MNDVKQKLTHRQRQALVTQQMIVAAARVLFLEQGYGAATIEAISTKAGVAVSTVYAVFKNKRGILKAIREEWHEQSGQRTIYTQALEERDPQKRMELAAHATRRQWETGSSMIAIYQGAASADAEAASELQDALEGRRRWLAQFIAGSLPVLRADLTVEKATALFYALTLVEIYQTLVEQSGWSGNDYEAWLAETLKLQLLARREL